MAFLIPDWSRNLNCPSAHSRHCYLRLPPKSPILFVTLKKLKEIFSSASCKLYVIFLGLGIQGFLIKLHGYVFSFGETTEPI